MGTQGYTLIRRKLRFSSKPGQDLGNFLCRSHHSHFKRWKLTVGTLKSQGLGWWFRQEQNLVVMLILKAWSCSWGSRDLLNPTKLQSVWNSGPAIPSSIRGPQESLFQQCLFTLSCFLTIIVIKSRTLGAAVQIFTFICNGAAYSTEHLWDVRQRGFGTVFFNIWRKQINYRIAKKRSCW